MGSALFFAIEKLKLTEAKHSTLRKPRRVGHTQSAARPLAVTYLSDYPDLEFQAAEPGPPAGSKSSHGRHFKGCKHENITLEGCRL